MSVYGHQSAGILFIQHLEFVFSVDALGTFRLGKFQEIPHLQPGNILGVFLPVSIMDFGVVPDQVFHPFAVRLCGSSGIKGRQKFDGHLTFRIEGCTYRYDLGAG